MQKALVAVSGGCDSLALLHMLFTQKKYNLIVAHVNYNYRDSAKRDENIVMSFCKKNNIPIYLLTIESKVESEGNFEDWARVKRYKFFKEVYDKEECKCLFVGHQKEDVIETYLMQKQRNSIVESYGLAEETVIQGMKVIRPLLSYTKQQLEKYCNENDLEYGVDETNFDIKYARNRIRHEVISKLSEKEKDEIIAEIDTLNINRRERIKEIKKKQSECLEKKNVLNIEKFNALNDLDKKEVLYYFVIDNVYRKISIKGSRITDILKKISSNKPNIVLACYDDITLYKEYNFLVIEKNKSEYCYEISDIDKKKIGDVFFIRDSGTKLERVVASKNQFPLYLKNYGGDSREINRMFIDKKVPLRKRKNWPIIVDKFGALLLVIGMKKFYNELCDIDGDFVDFYVHESEK